ncbi:MAG TPA: glycosyltransferase [Acidimicrobiales bacterium]
MPTTFVCHVPGSDPTALLQVLGADARLATTDDLRSADRSHSRVALLLASPADSAARMTASSGWSLPLALAHYERMLRTTFEAMAGLSSVIADEQVPAEQVLASLEGLETSSGEIGISSSQPTSSAATSAAPREIEVLWSVARTTIGSHRNFSPPPLGPESAWTTELLGLAEELNQVGDALLFASEQLAAAMQYEPAERFASSHKRREGEEDQFHEPGDGEPYRMNASEDREGYHEWLTRHRQPVVLGGVESAARSQPATRRRGKRSPLLSVVVPVYRTPIWALRRCVGSVLAQTFGEWELCLVDDASKDPELTSTLRSLAKLDRRITVLTSPSNGGISAATNRGVAATGGQFIAFLDHDDELAPEALAVVASSIAENPEADLFYSDEDKIDIAGERFDPLFKPDWSPDLLLSFAYTSHLTVVRRGLFDEVGGLRSDYDGSQDFDLTLRATEAARAVVHIPEVLYHWRSIPGSAASDTTSQQAKPWAYEAGRRAIEDALRRRSEPGVVSAITEFPGRYHVRRHVKDRPLVSIIIPFRDEPAMLATCARTLRADPGYDNFELVLVDNDSALPETSALLTELRAEPSVRVLQAPGPFNWAAINNAAARACDGEILLFLNNDIEARTPGWLDAMVGHVQRPEVGAVGARLLYADGTIQHAGVVVGLGGIAGHVLRGLPGDRPGYNSLAISTRDCSVVTGAAMMVRRELFVDLGGFDETLAVAFNDVDFCFKLRERGYYVVFTPLAELIHHESKSRGHTDDFAENELMLTRWGAALAAGDPYHNEHLSHWRYWCPLSTAQEDDRWKNYLETRVPTLVSSSSG